MADVNAQPNLVNVIDPDTLQVGSIPAEQLQEAQAQGFQQASPEQVHSFVREQKYGTPGQQAITGLEGIARGIAGPLAPAAEIGLGLTTKEAYRERREENPITSGVTEVAGLAGPMLGTLGTSALARAGVSGAAAAGEAITAGAKYTLPGLLEQAGAAGSKAMGFEGSGALSKVGDLATRGFIETSLLQGQDEATKAVTGEPIGTVGNVATRIGLSGLMGAGLGAGIGAVSPLWSATVGDKLGTYLEKFKARANGEAIALAPEVQGALDITKMEVDPIIRSAIAGDPALAEEFNILRETTTAPGHKTQEALKDFYQKAENKVLESVGRTSEDIGELSNFSKYDAGEKIKTQLTDTIKKEFEPAVSQFDETTKAFDKISLTNESDKIADQLAIIAEREGWNQMPSGEAYKLYQRVMEELPAVKSVEGLRKYVSNLWGDARKNPAVLYNPTGKITSALDDVLQETYLKAAGEKGPDFLMKFRLAKDAYRDAKGFLEELDSRLHVGKQGGPGTFVKALEENLTPETVLSRLSKTNDVGLQKLLAEKMPDIMPAIQKYHLDQELKKAIKTTADGHGINAEKFFKNLDKASPELRKFMLPAGAEEKLEGVRTLLKAIPEYKSSNTPKRWWAMFDKLPGSATAVASMIMGHNPAIGYILGQSAKWLSRDAPDAIRMATLKFLGSSGPVEPTAFKAMVDYFHHAIQGESAVNKAAKAIFKAGSEVLPRTQLPDQKDRDRLDKFLKKMQNDDSAMLDVGGKTGTYIPEHGSAIAQTSMNAVNYLNSLRPPEGKLSPLDKAQEPNAIQKQEFNEALDIAEQPLLVVDKIKDGTITPKDLNHLHNLYPGLMPKLTDKITAAMTEHMAKDGDIPYKTKLGLSLFMGQAMDSTMLPHSIMAAQPLPQQPPQQMAQNQPRQHGSLKNVNKLAQGSQTPEQMRVMQKSGQAKA